MNLIQKIFSYFKNTEPESSTSLSDDFQVNVLTNEPQLNWVYDNEFENDFPYWLSNEDALRDEAVLFGLANTNPQEKLKVVDAFFTQKTSQLKQKISLLNEKITELNMSMESKFDVLEKLRIKSNETEEQELETNNSVRILFGLVLSVGMCIGNYFLIRESIKPSFPINYEWISWGVFLAGMFSLYANKSLFHSPERPSWKQLVEELGMPFAAASFVFVQCLNHFSIIKSFSIYIFCFFIFLLSGKLFLGNIVNMQEQIKKSKANKLLKNNKKLVDTSWKVSINDIEKQIDAIRIEKWKILPDLNNADAELNKIRAEQEAIENLFMSEYNLAKSYSLSKNIIN